MTDFTVFGSGVKRETCYFFAKKALKYDISGILKSYLNLKVVNSTLNFD